MKRFFAVVGIVAFLAACSDSNMTTPTHLQPQAASRDAGDPPPPPLSGSGDGSLQVGSSDLVSQSATIKFPPDPCANPFPLSYSFSYLGNNPSNNQVVHASLDGTTGVTGDFDLHQNENGKSNAHGHITDGVFAFDIQSGDGTIAASVDNFGNVGGSFSFAVTGILTQLSTGGKCRTTGTLNGQLSHPT